MNGGWFFLFHGVMKHFRRSTEDGFRPESVCDITSSTWYGDGNEQEKEWLAGLPKCRVCKSRAGVS